MREYSLVIFEEVLWLLNINFVILSSLKIIKLYEEVDFFMRNMR